MSLSNMESANDVQMFIFDCNKATKSNDCQKKEAECWTTSGDLMINPRCTGRRQSVNIKTVRLRLAVVPKPSTLPS